MSSEIGNKRRILIIDDEIEVCRMLEIFFNGGGYEVKTTVNPLESLALYTSYCPDIVLLDIMMPELDGIEVLKRIKKHDESAKVIMISDWQDISMDGRGRALDNIFVERLWRSVKYEEVYLHDYATPVDAQLGLDRYFRFYNKERFNQSLNYRTLTEFYRDARNGFSKAWEYLSSDDNDQIISGAGSNAPRLNHRPR